MSRLLAAAAAALLVAGCGGSSGPGESAGAFLTRILQDELAGRWAAQWSELHPGHQRLITRAQYVLCSEQMATNVGTGKETYEVRDERDAPIHVRGVSERTAELVTIRVHHRGMPVPDTYHLHAVLDRGRWTWILGPAFLDALKHGRCLDGSPLQQP